MAAFFRLQRDQDFADVGLDEQRRIARYAFASHVLFSSADELTFSAGLHSHFGPLHKVGPVGLRPLDKTRTTDLVVRLSPLPLPQHPSMGYPAGASAEFSVSKPLQSPL